MSPIRSASAVAPTLAPCPTCGAAVEEPQVQKHQDWHALLRARLGVPITLGLTLNTTGL